MTHPDVLLVTVECLRADYRHHLQPERNHHEAVGVVPGHYTRPSLAGILSGQYRAAAQADIHHPTLPSVFSEAGYTTIGVCHSPQAATYSSLGFDESQVPQPDGGRLARGSRVRERLAEHRLVRWVYRHLRPKSATLADVQPDTETVSDALAAYERVPRPRLLWVHLMDSHRPYGRGGEALPDDYGRTAAYASSGVLPRVHETVVSHYERALNRAHGYVTELVDGVADDAEWLVMGDHGEELGEAGYYFHSGFRRRTPTSIVEVPVFASFDLPGRVSGVDVPALLADRAGVPRPDRWDGQPQGSSVRLTYAPWGDQTALRVGAPSGAVRLGGAESSVAASGVGDERVKKQLAALGYR